MSASYRPVTWNSNKIVYDVIMLLAVTAYLAVFLRVAPMLRPPSAQIDEAILNMRTYGSCAFLMLSFILCIGPLARLDQRWLPILYNRRHFGVVTCVIALLHVSHVLGWYFAFSPTDPLVAMLSSNTSFTRLAGFPFEILGLVALIILVLLAVTSHDFWLNFLTPPVWKALHMCVYAAYAAIVLHVAMGPMLAQTNPTLVIIVGGSAIIVCGLHVAAAIKGVTDPAQARDGAWVVIGKVGDLIEGRGKVVPVAGQESIAVFRHEGRLSAVANACAHQNGPLGEGRIIDGCITCPWHGFQYRPQDGCAPPPFTEKLATYRIKVHGDVVLVDTRANPPGTFVEPVAIAGAGS